MDVIGLVAVVLILGVVPMFAIWTGSRNAMRRQAQATAEKAAQYAVNNQELADRVSVLERIVTDRGYDVATQIEALRDARRIEELLDKPADKTLS